MRAIWPFACLLVLPACEPSTQPDSGNVPATNQQEAVIALPEGQRLAVLLRAIRDAGLPCQHVESAERLPDTRQGPRWRAKCDDGSFHLVSIRADGVAEVVSRTT